MLAAAQAGDLERISLLLHQHREFGWIALDDQGRTALHCICENAPDTEVRRGCFCLRLVAFYLKIQALCFAL